MIIFSTFVKDAALRVVYLISIVFMFLWVTAKYQPFLKGYMNKLEFYSNFCALIIIITSAFYIENRSEIMKSIFFVFIILINLYFLFKWLVSILKIMLIKYENLLIKCPHLFVFFFAFVKITGDGNKEKKKKSLKEVFVDFNALNKILKEKNALAQLQKITFGFKQDII